MKTRFCLPMYVIALVVSMSFPGITSADERPNVILVMCDDLGWGDVGFNGSTVSKTPHLDAMARGSLKFNRFYAAAPVCSPTRGSALTGRHPFRYGIYTANTGHMKKGEFTLAEAMKSAGYRTGHFGKWHLGTLTTKVKDANRGKPGDAKNYARPDMHGFDTYFCTESKVPTYDPLLVPKKFARGESRKYGWIPVANDSEAEFYGTHYWTGEDEAVNEGLRGDDSKIVVDHALPFIANATQSKQPFFAVIWFHTPHLPVVAGKEHRERFAKLSVKEQLYYGCIAAMDDQIGRLRQELRSLNVADNTMLWFASDNGPENGTPGSAGPFRGRKRSLYEGGVRVPGLLEWPAKIKQAGETEVPAVTSDYLPTTLAAAGFTEAEGGHPLDGTNLMPLIEGTMAARPRPIGFQSAGMSTWNDNQYKLVVAGKNKQPELYDLLADKEEKHDIASEHAEIVERMHTELKQWQASCKRSDDGLDYQ